jgi:hypothetical protein
MTKIVINNNLRRVAGNTKQKQQHMRINQNQITTYSGRRDSIVIKSLKELTLEAIDFLERSYFLPPTSEVTHSVPISDPQIGCERQRREIITVVQSLKGMRSLTLANTALKLAIGDKTATLLVTDNSSLIVGLSLLFWRAGIVLSRAAEAAFSEEEFKRLMVALGEMKGAPLFMATGTTCSDLEETIQSAVSNFGVERFVLDNSSIMVPVEQLISVERMLPMPIHIIGDAPFESANHLN